MKLFNEYCTISLCVLSSIFFCGIFVSIIFLVNTIFNTIYYPGLFLSIICVFIFNFAILKILQLYIEKYEIDVYEKRREDITLENVIIEKSN